MLVSGTQQISKTPLDPDKVYPFKLVLYSDQAPVSILLQNEQLGQFCHRYIAKSPLPSQTKHLYSLDQF
jgi:hypothetical protein